MQNDPPNTTVNSSHRLLASFPLASTTPTSHVSRHLHTMTVGAPDPYAYQRAQYRQEFRHLSSYQVPQNDGGYWQAAQDNASRYINIQQQYEYHNHWPSLQPSTAYTPHPFSQSLFYPNRAAAAYPTPPPPPGIAYTSSSLAFALGRPTPEQSPAFFNDFLAKKTADLNLNTPSTQQLTPRKRKPAPQPESPSKKRLTTPRPRRNSQVYVDVPPAPWLTPTSSQVSKSPSTSQQRGSSPDAGRYASESPTRLVKESARKTGDRDERPPLEKLRSLLEDLFEAEDSLSPETDVTELSCDFFSPHSNSGSRPHLHISQIRKLTKSVAHVGQSSRSRTSSGSAHGKGRRLAEVETPSLSRILKILERSVKAAEDLNPFGDGMSGARTVTTAPSPVKKASKGSKGAKQEELEEEVVVELSEEAHIALDRALDLANESILAADCCLAILSGDRLPKELYSEELIAGILTVVKNQLTNIIYSVVENAPSAALYHLTKASQSGAPCAHHHRRVLGEMHQAILALIPRLVSLISNNSVSMSDSIIIQAVYIAIGPFFILEPPESKKEDVVLQTFGKSAMRGLRLEALSLIRSIFAHHEEQRSWIIEEILSSLIKLSDSRQKAGQFKLRDGRSIRTVSALLLQLIQTSAHDIRLQAGKINKRREHRSALQRQDSTASMEETLSDELEHEELVLYAHGLESATKAAKAIVIFLNQRSGKGKTTKNANEAEYRAIFDALISDVLVVLHWPEWPAASLLLNIASRFLVSSLDDLHSASTDNNATRSTALEHLGVIAARIRTARHHTPDQPRTALRLMDEIISHQDVEGLNKLVSSHKEVWRYLDKQASEDQAFSSAREFAAVTLGQELATALKAIGDTPSDFGLATRAAMRSLWTRSDGDVFDASSQEDATRVDVLSQELGGVNTLSNSFQPILAVVLRALDAPVIFMRTKALKALGQIVGSDQSVLAAPNVRHAIEVHLLDNSPAVRDAAVELIGKYVLDSADVAESYWEKIADRIADTAVSVRKRVIKLLKSFYTAMDNYQRRVDIGTRLVLRTMDEDTGVRDLAIKTAQELWFEEESYMAKHQVPMADDGRLVEKVSVIMGVCANFKDRHSPLEELLQSVVTNVNSSSSQFVVICQTLVDGLVDACDFPGFTVVNCIRTIYLFVSAQPSALSAPNASTLLPYLRTTSMSDEQNVVDYLLKIFRVTVPFLPKTSAKLGQELQQVLQPMIIKPANSGGVQTLQEVVALLCTVVKHLTHEYSRLVTLFKSCDARLQKWVNKPPKTRLAGADSRTVSILILIVALLAENCDFDTIKRTNPALASDLDSISKDTLIGHVYTTLLKLHNRYEDDTLKARILQCLGFLFKAQPSLMTLESSAVIMDEIFSSSEDTARTRLLRIMQDFLTAEADKHAALLKATTNANPQANEVNMEQLVGNTEEFADSGVASAIIQRYLNHVLEAALSKNPQLQATAVEILTFTVKQGLAHPLQSFPVVVALETSENDALSSRGATLHGLLHSKHASLLNSRFIDCARASFDYQVSLQPKSWRGYRTKPAPVALLQRWYSLVREKRPARLDFLRSLSKSFNVDPSLNSTQASVNFARYMAENFATFEYKSQEEVLSVIKHLTSTLSTAGMQVMHLISPSNLLQQLHGDSNMTQVRSEEAVSGKVLSVDVARTSIIVGMIAILKSYLQGLYGLSDEKCSKFQMGKKSALGDKSTQKRHGSLISWERMPFAELEMRTEQDLEVQRAKFIELWNEDGVIPDSDEEPIPN